MLIGITGTIGSGKTEVARYLSYQGFRLLSVGKNPIPTTHSEEENNYPTPPANDLVPTGYINVYRHFQNYTDLLDFVTSRWNENWVVIGIQELSDLELLQKRPFFLHVYVDAPLALRHGRYTKKHKGEKVPSLEEFSRRNDVDLFDPERPLIEVINQAQVKIINTSNSIESLYMKLSDLNLLDFTRLRPTWDSYFMRLADLAALRSNCMKRRVGCVIVRQNRVIATGYNGTPRHLTNCNEGGCPRCNNGEGSGAGLSTCLCLHAEENALLEAGRDRIGGDGVLYCNTCPCLTCSVKIVQSGIKEVVYAQRYSMDDLSHKVLSEGHIILRQFSPPSDKVFI